MFLVKQCANCSPEEALAKVVAKFGDSDIVKKTANLFLSDKAKTAAPVTPVDTGSAWADYGRERANRTPGKSNWTGD
jgi:hypothetical protein